MLPSGTEDHPYLVKSDLNVNNKNRLSVRYDRSVRKDLNLSQSGSATDTKEDRYAFGGPIWNLVGNYTTTLSNRSFNEARLFYGSNKAPIVCNKSGTGGSAQLAKAPVGTFAHIEYPGALFGCPTFTGLEGEENIVLADNLSMSRGRHQLKIGAQGNQVRTIIDVTNYHDGFWSHPTDALFNRADPATYPDVVYRERRAGPREDEPLEQLLLHPGYLAGDRWPDAESGVALRRRSLRHGGQ